VSQHPVDALKDLGMPMTPEHEAELRAICDEPVAACRHGVIGHCYACQCEAESALINARLITRGSWPLPIESDRGKVAGLTELTLTIPCLAEREAMEAWRDEQ